MDCLVITVIATSCTCWIVNVRHLGLYVARLPKAGLSLSSFMSCMKDRLSSIMSGCVSHVQGQSEWRTRMHSWQQGSNAWYVSEKNPTYPSLPKCNMKGFHSWTVRAWVTLETPKNACDVCALHRICFGQTLSYSFLLFWTGARFRGDEGNLHDYCWVRLSGDEGNPLFFLCGVST